MQRPMAEGTTFNYDNEAIEIFMDQTGQVVSIQVTARCDHEGFTLRDSQHFFTEPTVDTVDGKRVQRERSIPLSDRQLTNLAGIVGSLLRAFETATDEVT